MRQLAAATDVTPGLVSQVENGHTTPSIPTLVRFAQALDVRVGELFDVRPPAETVLRRRARKGYEYPERGLRDEVVSSDPGGRLEVLLAYVDPGGGTGPEPYAHGAETEFVLVLSGQIEITLDGESYLLEEGDTLTFSGAIPHAYVNPSDERAELLWAMTPASF